MNQNICLINRLGSDLSTLARYFSEARASLLLGQHNVCQIFIENDERFFESGDAEIYDAYSKELISSSVGNFHSSLNCWGGYFSSKLLNELRSEVWREEMGFWFSPLPWHVRQWRVLHENAARYHQERNKHLSRWHFELANEAKRNFPIEEVWGKKEVVDVLDPALAQFGFKSAGVSKNYATWKKSLRHDWTLLWRFDFAEAGMHSSGGVYGFSLSFLLSNKFFDKASLPRQFKAGFPISYHLVAPYLGEAYSVFRDGGEFLNALNAHLMVFSLLRQEIESIVDGVIDDLSPLLDRNEK
ncbi:hypothetical protein IGB42_03007 [Andreprevotia sp. IGB-42]|uniref:hypothetical protein n=1 Tax=Andreprevotia sp. IGB-42 TaxID=2497473 RepID=UPI001358BD98|nr:hypothetical protein [Andreprevotia sp. IGB-42]KAF0812715.1 hypothetical protein IGB42_03007 [Andreprevotia sp. IGB-42]